MFYVMTGKIRKTQHRTTFVIDKKLLAKVDKCAKAEDRSRNWWICETLRRRVESRDLWSDH